MKTRDELLIENRMLEDEVKRLTAILENNYKDVRLLQAGPEGSGFMFDLEGGPIQYIAEYLAEVLGYKDAKEGEDLANYAEIQAKHPIVGRMVVTIQRVSGLTPNEKVKNAERKIKELEDKLVIAQRLQVINANR